MVKSLKLLIKNNLKTFISILILTLLGVGFFVGMKSTVPNLKETVDIYYDKYDFYDIMLESYLGFNEDDKNNIKNIKGVKLIEGSNKKDGIINFNKTEYVLRVHSYTNNKNTINKIELIKGNYPVEKNEIVLENKLSSYFKIGDFITISGFNDKLKIVGFIKSPMYLNSDKGTTNLLSGQVNYYGYVYYDIFDDDSFSNLYIKIEDGYTKEQVLNNIDKEEKDVLTLRYNDSIEEYKKIIEEKQKELDKNKEEFNKKINNYSKEIEEAELKIRAADESIPNEKEAEIILSNKKNELAKYKKELDDNKKLLDESRAEYNRNKKEYDENYSIYSEKIDDLQKTINDNQSKIDRLKVDNNNLENQVNNTTDPDEKSRLLAQIENNKEEIRNYETIVGFTKNLLYGVKDSLSEYENKLNSAKRDLDSGQAQYERALSEYNKYYAQANAKSAKEIIEQAKTEVARNKKILLEKKNELESEKKRVENEFYKYQVELDDAKDYLKLISVSSWKTETRENNSIYQAFLSDINRINKISNLFPIIFYLVAVLITLTNITRIIEKDRCTIGLYKALGYKKNKIDNSYVLFAFLATIIGSIIGSLIGLYVIPKIFYRIYCMMYYLPKYSYLINYKILLSAILLAILLVYLTVKISVHSTLKETPVDLLRPKKSEKGKIVLLEKIDFIWNRLNFSNKVTARNVFKNPKLFIMTIIGVVGCITLIISGFNLKSSIANILPLQYGKIFDINVQVIFKGSTSRSIVNEEKIRINDLKEVDDSILVYLQNASIKKENIYFVVPEDNDLINDFVIFRNKNREYHLDNDGAFISRKICNKLNIAEGDIIELIDSNNNKLNIKISKIVDNYIDNYIYLSKKYYEELLNEEVKYNSLMIRTINDNYREGELTNKINENDNVSYLTYTSVAKKVYEDLSKTLNYIVYILVISAVLLAFIVLYNLNNLNVSERKMEIATLKVLGFTKKETYKYIENEIKILTLIGIIIGIIFGYIFSNILISNCELERTMYDYSINYLNYIYAILLTIGFMILTSLFSRHNIDNIDMIESLKQVE